MDPKRLGNAMLGLRDYTTADVLNQPIRRGGVLPVTEYADRTEWDLSSGIPGSIGRALTAPARAYRGEMTDNQMIDEGANLAGWLTLGGYMSPKPANALGAGGGGIKAFHGSPHDFDKFDMSKIGTGEGAQAYGHGLYFAENEGVADWYKNTLSRGNRKGASSLDDAVVAISDAVGATGRVFSEPITSDGNRVMVFEETRPERWFGKSSKRPIGTVDTIRSNDGKTDRYFAHSNLPGALDKLLSNSGHMYEVRINADPADFLDWDKPLSQQSEKVRPALERLLVDRNKSAAEAAGIEGYQPNPASFSDVGGHTFRSDTDLLREAGIPGIRYLDQMSRGAGEGSSNYVVFDDAMIEIMRKYGLLGPVAAGTVAAATNDEGPIY